MTTHSIFSFLIILFSSSTPQLHEHSSGPLCPYYVQVSCPYVGADQEWLETGTVGDCISGHL